MRSHSRLFRIGVAISLLWSSICLLVAAANWPTRSNVLFQVNLTDEEFSWHYRLSLSGLRFRLQERLEYLNGLHFVLEPAQARRSLSSRKSTAGEMEEIVRKTDFRDFNFLLYAHHAGIAFLWIASGCFSFFCALAIWRWALATTAETYVPHPQSVEHPVVTQSTLSKPPSISDDEYAEDSKTVGANRQSQRQSSNVGRLLATLAACGFAGIAGQQLTRLFYKPQVPAESTFSDAMKGVVSKLNEGLPKMVDRVTRIDSVTVKDNTFTYNYVWLDGPRTIDQQFRLQLTRRACESELRNDYLAKGITVIYSYSTSSGRNIGSVAVDEAACLWSNVWSK